MSINNVFFSLTGDCNQNGSGAFSLTIDGNTPDYTIMNLSPTNTIIPLGPYETGYTATNLTGGTYTLLVVDALYPQNQGFLVELQISTGTCVSIIGVEHTICGFDNGSITAKTQYQYQAQTTYYLYDDTNTLIQTVTTPFSSVIFQNLSPGFYYVAADDGAGCSGTSESILIKDSSALDFSLYVVDNSSCYFNLGKIFVSGLTGTAPYTYQWSNGVTGINYITGLTQGSYSVTIEDASGCRRTKFASVTNASQLSVVSIISENPTCFNADGELTIFISGGSAPYYFSGSNGVTEFTFNQQLTFTNLAGGTYYFTITDAGLCSVTTSTTLIPSAGFSVQSVNVVNSNCNGNGGRLSITIIGGPAIYTYTLENSSGTILTINGSNTNAVFDDLTNDTYTLTISSNTTDCIYTNVYTITNDPPFDISGYTTGTTCNKTNGFIEVAISVPGIYIYKLNGVLYNPSTTTSTGATFTNLAAGNYTVEAIDVNACSNIINFTIPTSQSVDFITIVDGNDIYLNIIQGTPPYTIIWFSVEQNLPYSGTSLMDVPPGTYFVRVIDANGCSKISKGIVVSGVITSGRTSTFSICASIFVQTNTITRGITQMFFDGYMSLIQFDVNCSLQRADFTTSITFNGTVYTDTFFTTTNITNIPSDNLFFDSIRNILLSIPGIGEVNIDPFSNTIEIITDCESEINLSGVQILIELLIEYEIVCENCAYLFKPCLDSVDYEPINVAIIPSNFNIGDIIEYNGYCYEYYSAATGSPVVVKDAPDYTAGNCINCLSKRYFVFKNCFGGEHFVQPVLTAPNGVQLEVGESFGWSLVPVYNPNPNGYFERYTCFWYVGSYYGMSDGTIPGGGPKWGGLIPFPIPAGIGILTNEVDYFTTYVQSVGYPNAGFNPNSPFKGTGLSDQCNECCVQQNTVCSNQFADP